MRNQRVGAVLASQLHVRLANRQRVGLREKVTHQLIMVGNDLALEVDTLLALDDADEITRDGTALVDELVERVLPVRAGFAEINLASFVVQLKCFWKDVSFLYGRLRDSVVYRDDEEFLAGSH